jgi:Flp pilus assembly protein TadD
MNSANSMDGLKIVKKAMPYIFIWVAILGCYGLTLRHQFTGFDEDGIIIENYHITKDIGNIGKVFGEPLYPRFNRVYRPVLMASFMLDAQFGGTAPFVYHCSNVVLHGVAVSLLFALFVALGLRPGLALFGAVLFAVHPLLTQAVAWIPGRNDVLLGIGVFGAFLFLARYLQRPAARYYFLHLFFMAFAVFSKETAVVLPFMFGAALYLVFREKITVPRVGLLIAGWVAVLALWVAGRSVASVPSPFTAAQAVHWVQSGIPMLASYFGNMLVPVHLSVLPVSASTGAVIAGGICLLFMAAVVVMARPERKRFAIFAICWLIVFLAPTLIIIGEESVYYNHRTYVPLAGFVMLVLEALAVLLRRIAVSEKTLAAAGLLVLMLVAAATITHSRCFADASTFWHSATAAAPGSRIARSNAAVTLARTKQYAIALESLRSLLKGDQRDAPIYNNIGTVYHEQKNYQQSIAAYHAAIAADPAFRMTYYNLGNVYLTLLNYEQAVHCYRQALSFDRNDVDALYNLGVAYYRSGIYREAREYFLNVAAIDPVYSPNLQTAITRCDECIRQCKE